LPDGYWPVLAGCWSRLPCWTSWLQGLCHENKGQRRFIDGPDFYRLAGNQPAYWSLVMKDKIELFLALILIVLLFAIAWVLQIEDLLGEAQEDEILRERAGLRP
jgi:hypothetical protein